MLVDIYNHENKMIQNNAQLKSALDTEDWLRSVHVILYDEKQEFLICQNHSDSLYFCSKWDIGIFGFLQSGENPMDAASRICNEHLAIYIETNKLNFLTKHSEISIQAQKPLKRHVQTLICLIPSALLNPDYIDNNLFHTVSWENLDAIKEKIMQQSSAFAYHPSHTIEPLERISYWKEMLDKAKQHSQEDRNNYLLRDLESLSKKA